MKHNHNKDQAQWGLQNFIDMPALIAKYGKGYEHGDARHDELCQNRHRQCSTIATDAKLGFNHLFERLYIVLKFAREEFADFVVDAVYVRDQSEQSQQQ